MTTILFNLNDLFLQNIYFPLVNALETYEVMHFEVLSSNLAHLTATIVSLSVLGVFIALPFLIVYKLVKGVLQ